jgi:uncharacterized membrane protein YeaQ/YmgE (transglycosylase-associated protein family)
VSLAAEGGEKMIGMKFGAFLTLLILGCIAAIVMQFVIRYRVLGIVDGFFAKWIAGWIGAWLGGPVLGYWWFQIQNVYIIPALVGAFVGAFSLVALAKASGQSATPKLAMQTVTPAIQDQVRKLA